MTLQGPAIAVFPLNPLLFSRGFCPGHHGGQYPISLLRLRHHSGPLDSIIKRNSPYRKISMSPRHPFLAADSPFDITRHIKLGIAHTLNAACHNDIRISGLNHHGSKTDHIQSGTAAPVQGDSGDRIRPTCFEKRHACDVDVFTTLVRLTQNDLIDLNRVQPCSFDSFIQNQSA